MDDRQQPGQVGGGVHKAPGPWAGQAGEAGPQEPARHDDDDQVGGDRPEAGVKGPVSCQERHQGVVGPGTLGGNLRRDMNNQEYQRGQRDCPVQSLSDDTPARRHHDPVAGDQADSDRRRHCDKCEYAGGPASPSPASSGRENAGTGCAGPPARR
jgi:hypothetical protein